MPTALDTILAALRADPGLRSLSAADMAAGLTAADTLNVLLMKIITQTQVNVDGRISEADMRAISVATYANPADYVRFLEEHGNDNGTIESGYHHLQDDGGTLMFRGRNFADTVADAIYHFGFKIQNGRYYNEDGNDNETAADVAGWLNFFLNGENIVWGGAGNDMLGSGEYSSYFAAARNETFITEGGNDRVWADSGHDRILLGDGQDEAGGGTGNDRIYGGGGNDRAWGEAGADTVNGDSGNDELSGGDDNDALDGGGGNDTLYGGRGTDTMLGNAGNDVLHGDDSGDRMDGGSGDDRIYGGAHSDWLYGSAGNDEIGGGEGIDAIRGGTGADRIHLWESIAAADRLYFRSGDSGRTLATIDRVEGFESGRDKIVLEGMGNLRMSTLDFLGEGQGSYYADGRYLRIDDNGDRAVDMIIDFAWSGDLRASDFIIA